MRQTGSGTGRASEQVVGISVTVRGFTNPEPVGGIVL